MPSFKDDDQVSPKPHVAVGDDHVSMEWIGDSARFFIVIDEDTAESSWGFVSLKGSMLYGDLTSLTAQRMTHFLDIVFGLKEEECPEITPVPQRMSTSATGKTVTTSHSADTAEENTRIPSTSRKRTFLNSFWSFRWFRRS